MRDQQDGPVSPRLHAAIEVLRESRAPDAAWRSALLDRIAAEHDRPGDNSLRLVPRRASRRWSVRPIVAVAAGVACVAIGAATSALVLRGRIQPPGAAIADVATSDVIARPVRFTFVAPSAGQVSLVGDFNRWDPVALPLRRAADGRTWEVELRLPPGRYGYSFVVDGRIARDPTAPQDTGGDFGTPNSILLLRGS
jgi:transposase InsO family protein